jgi:hypothetical protein
MKSKSMCAESKMCFMMRTRLSLCHLHAIELCHKFVTVHNSVFNKLTFQKSFVPFLWLLQ